MALEDVLVVAVKYRLNGQLSMRAAGVDSLPTWMCVITRPDPIWIAQSGGVRAAGEWSLIYVSVIPGSPQPDATIHRLR